MKSNKNLRENRRNRNCLSESEGCNDRTRFQGQLRFPRQAGDVPQPCRTGCNWFPKCNVSHETLQKLLLGKTIFSVRQKGVPPLLLPASVLQLPRCLVWIYILDSHDSTLFELDSFKKCNCSRKNKLRNTICFANVGYSPTPRQHFWKTAAPKNFLFACGSFLQKLWRSLRLSHSFHWHPSAGML